MAENIVKLRVDGKDFDQNIKSARQGLLAMEQACRKVGGTLEVVEKDELEFVRAMGEMETTAKTSKGQLREMTEAINDLSLMYKRLTNEEKQSPFGKALSASMEQLKGRAADIQDQMADLNEELKHLSSDTGFTDGMRNMTGVIGSCASAVVAFTGDSKELDVVIKDLAKIQTTVAAVESLTTAFQKQNLVMLKNPYVLAATAAAALAVAVYELTSKENEAAAQIKMTDDAIKTQAQSLIDLQKIANGAASAIGNLTKSQAKAQYDSALEDLTAIQDRMKAQKAYVKQLEIARDAEKKKYEASGRTVQSNRLDGGVGTTYDNEAYNNWKKYEQQVKDQTAVLEEMKKAAKEADAAVSTANAKYRRASEDPTQTKVVTGASDKEDIPQVEGSIAALTAQIKEYRDAQQLTTNNTDWKTLQDQIDATQAKIDEITGKVKEVKLPEMTTGFSGPSTGAFSAWAQSIQQQMSTVDITTPLYQNLQEQLADTTTLQNLVKTAMENGFSFKDLNFDVEGMWSKILGPEGVENAEWQGIVDAINAKLAELDLPPIQLKFETGEIDTKEESKGLKDVQKHAQGVSSALSAASSAFSQYAGESEEAAAAQKAFTIAAAIATLVGQFAAIPKGVEIWSWIAGTIAGTATLIATIAQIKSSTNSYAEGGWVGGSSGGYVGDAVPAFLNKGEYVMTANDVETANNNLQSAQQNAGGGGRSTISGEQIVTVVNAYGRRTGRGEILR